MRKAGNNGKLRDAECDVWSSAHSHSRLTLITTNCEPRTQTVNSQLRILIAGGGTGGHIIPALAVARELVERHGAEVLFVGTARGLETRLVPEAGFPLRLIDVGPLKNVSLATRLRTLFRLPGSIVDCKRLIREFRPDAVLGVGGYASGPAMAAALWLKVPAMAFEPNAMPGLANRLVGKRVQGAAVNFPAAAKWFRNAEVTGVPVRPEFFSLRRASRSASSVDLWRFAGRAHLQHASAETDAGALVRSPRTHGSAPERGAPRRGDRKPIRPAAPIPRAGRCSRSSTTCPRDLPARIWSCRAAALPRWPNWPPPASLRCWCLLPPPPTSTSAAMPKPWLQPARPSCWRRRISRFPSTCSPR